MTIHWSLFVPAVVLLMFPADRLLSSSVQLRNFESFFSLENSPRHRPWWWVPALWLDPVRGLLGTLLLQHALAISAIRWDLAPKLEYAVLVALLTLAVICQTLTRRGAREAILAPMGFVTGVMAALVPWPVALISSVVAAVGLFAFRQFHGFFLFGFAAVGLLGAAFRAPPMWIIPAAALFALPIAVALVSGCALELPTRTNAGPDAKLRPAR